MPRIRFSWLELVLGAMLMAWAHGAWAQTMAAAPAENPAAVAAKPDREPFLRSRIVKVTVFSDRALVTRRAGVELSEGDHRLAFDKLPGDLDVNSVQVRGKGAGLIKGVSMKSQAVAGTGDEDLRRLERQKTELDNKLTEVQDQINQAKKEKDFIDAIAKRLTTATEKSDQAELSPQKWIEMVTFYRKKLANLDQEIRETSARLPELKEKIAKVVQEIQQIQREQRGKQRVEVWVEMPTAGEILLELDYIVYGPRWYPRYDVRADSRQGTVQIAYRGMIIQNTSEDWNHVEMTLSTAQPQAGGQHPDLTPWRISPYVAAPAPVYSRRPAGAAQMFNAMPMAKKMAKSEPAEAYDELAVAPEMEVSQAAVDSNAASVVFNLKGPQTVRSDNQPQESTILVHAFPAEFRYSTAPKLSSRAYLKAKIKNATEYPLLPGQTSLFLDNNFVANGQLAQVSPSEEFWAFLGADDGIKVEHKLINRKDQKEGMFGGRNRVEFEYLIQVTNHKKQTREIVVWDQIPLSASGEIQVELLEPAYKQDTDALKKNSENFLEWLYHVEPGQTVKIPLKFNVSYPKDMKVQGL